MPKFLKVILYPIAFVVSFALFLGILFPYDSVKDRVAREIEGAFGGGYRITIGSLLPIPMSGAMLRDVEIQTRGDKEAAPVKISQAKLAIALIPLLSGSTEVGFDIRTGQGRPAPSTSDGRDSPSPLISKGEGRAVGDFSWGRGEIGINAKLDKFDLALASFLTQKSGLRVTGLVGGTIDLEIYPQDPLRNTGNINLQILDLSLGEVSFADGALTIPALRLAQADGSRLDVAISRGNFEVKGMQLAGGDISLDSNGKIYGARSIDNYRFNLRGNLKVSQEVADKLQILSLVEKQKTADGEIGRASCRERV